MIGVMFEAFNCFIVGWFLYSNITNYFIHTKIFSQLFLFTKLSTQCKIMPRI
jgi:hypothetical protein